MKKIHQDSMTDQIKRGLSQKGLNTKSIVAFLIFGMIVLVFVLSDLTGRHQGASSMGAAAEVNGEIISIKDFQDEEGRLAQYYGQLFGGQFDGEMQRSMLRGEVMNSLVTKSLAAQAAENEGIYATDAEVRNMIVNELAYFKKDGVFQTDVYKSILQANRMTPGEFESKIRKDIKNQRSRQLFESSLGASQLQKEMQSQLKASKINVEYIQLSAKDFNEVHTVSAEDIAAKLKQDDFSKKVEEYYNKNLAQFETAEQVHALHILVKATPETDAASKAKAEGFLKRAQKEDFGKLASEVSEDPGSKAKKGDLGFFSRGQMVKEFEDVAFNQAVGQVSGLVKSSFGYHIIKVLEKKPYVKKSIDMAKVEIAKKLLNDESYLDFVKGIESRLSEGKVNEAISEADKFKFKWKETGFFDISIETAPVINSAQVMKEALTLKKQAVASRLVREGEVQYLVRLKDIKSDSAGTNAALDLTMSEKQSSMQVYSAWVDTFKKSAKIQTNSSLTGKN